MTFRVQKKVLLTTSVFIVAFFLYLLNFDSIANLFFVSGIFFISYSSVTYPELLVVGLIIIETQLFGAGTPKVFGVLPEKLEIIIFIFSYGLWARNSFKKRNQIPKSYLLLLYTVFIIFSGSVMACITIRQSFIIGIFLQTRLIVLLSIFPIVSLMNNDEMSYTRLWILIKKIALFQAFINILQFFIYPQIQFLSITSENLRFGSIRITYGFFLIAIALMMSFSELMRKIDKKNIFYSLLYMFELLFVCKTRMVIFGVLISIFVAFVLSLKNKDAWRRALLICFCVLAITPVILPRVSELFNLTQQEVSTNSGNYVARVGEVDFYTSQVNNPIFGRGYISPKTAGGEALDTKYGFYSLTDIGIVALYVINGITGLIWFFILIVILLNRIKKTRYSIFAIEYLVYTIVTSVTLMSSYFGPEYLILGLTLLSVPKTSNECA